MSWDWKVISPIIIAVCALVLTVWQGMIVRRHNRLSVTPYLNTWRHFNEQIGHFSYEICNNGIGPAIIQSLSIHVDGQPIEGEGPEIIEKALKIFFPKHSYTSTQSFVEHDYLISPKEKIALIDVRFLKPSPSQEEVKNAIERTRLIIAYKSIYRKKFLLDTNPPKSYRWVQSVKKIF